MVGTNYCIYINITYGNGGNEIDHWHHWWKAYSEWVQTGRLSLDTPSAIPCSMPAKNHSASWLINFVSSYAAPLRPNFSSESDTANEFFPLLSLSDTWTCLTEEVSIFCLLNVKLQTHYNREAIQHTESVESLIQSWVESLTFPHGLAMKLGITPCFMPILFATYLYSIALSAIRRAEVYASAVS